MNLDNTIFYTSVIDYRISITPLEVQKNINSLILEKVRNNIGDRCFKQGYISKNSIKIIQRSIGNIESSHFNGNIIYNLKLEVKICCPVENDIITCRVIGKNKMGILAKNEPLMIALSKLHHENLDFFENVKKDDVIKVKVICSKFELNDTEISVIGKLVN